MPNNVLFNVGLHRSLAITTILIFSVVSTITLFHDIIPDEYTDPLSSKDHLFLQKDLNITRCIGFLVRWR